MDTDKAHAEDIAAHAKEISRLRDKVEAAEKWIFNFGRALTKVENSRTHKDAKTLAKDVLDSFWSSDYK